MPASARPLDLVPHRRYNPLLRQWILVSPQRTDRPWQGETSKQAAGTGMAYDPACYLCPGNARSGGVRNPAYTGVFAFDNDFPALLSDLQPEAQPNASPLLVAEPERGRCRVLCFHPNHSLTLARMDVPAIAAVVDAWAGETAALGDLPYINHVQIFENRGAMMGASNPHPHCQIWATEHVPDEPLRELAAQQEYWEEHHRCLLCDYVATELAQAERMVAENGHFVAVVPFWATWPFETLVLPRRHLGSLTDFTAAERSQFRGDSEGSDHALRQPLSDQLSLQPGLPPAADRRQSARFHALPRTFLPAAAAFGPDSQVHGWLRDVWQPAARPYAGDRGRTPARPARKALPRLSYCLSCS